MEDEYYPGKESSRPTSKKRLTAKQEEYLQLLQERNRLKKQMSEKSHEAKLHEERERGFSTHFAGANATEKKSKRSTTPVMTSRVPTVSGIPLGTASPQQQPPKDASQRSRVRRGWGGDPVIPVGAPKQTRQPILHQSPITVPSQQGRRRLSEDEEAEDDISDDDKHTSEEEEIGEDYPEDFEYYYDSMEDEGPPVVSARSEHSEEEEELSHSVVFEDSLCNVESITVTKNTIAEPASDVSAPPPVTETASQPAQPSRGARRGWGSAALPTAVRKPASTTPPTQFSAPNTASPLPGLGGSGAEAERSTARVLSQRLAALDEQKQQQLLLLLQQLESDAPGELALPPKRLPTSAIVPQKLDYSTSTSPRNDAKEAYEAKSSKMGDDKAVSPSSASSSVVSQSISHTDVRSASIAPTPLEDDRDMLPNSSKWEPVPENTEDEGETAPPESNEESSKYELPTIRIRVHSNWKDTKYFSLLHVLLSQASSPPSCAADTFDALSYYSSTVKVGLATLPKYHASMKSISNMLAFSRAAVNPTALPLEPPLPTEIILSPINSIAAINISDMVLHVYTVTSSLSDTSSIRDFDVFVDKMCLWSGEAENKSGIISIPLKEKSESGRVVAKHFAPSPQVTIMDLKEAEGVEAEDACTSKPQNDKPVWLTGTGSRPPSAATKDIFGDQEGGKLPCMAEENKSVDRVSSSRRLSRRQCSQIQEDKEKQDTADTPIPSTNNSEYSEPVAKSVKPTPRRRNRQTSAASVPTSDEEVRKSLDAIKVAGMRSRSRLQPSTSASAGVIPQVDSALYSSTLPSAVASAALPDTALESVLTKPPETVSDKLKSRSQRISAVQDTVSSALANLSQVMSTLNRADSNKGGLRRVSSLEALQETTTPPEELAAPSLVPDEELRSSPPLPSLAVPTAPLPTPPTSPTIITPLLPCGTVLMLLLHSNWGDPYYIGCNGIDIFDDTGDIAPIRKIESVPSDVNVLPEYADVEIKDPRVVANLIDGDNYTRNDMHIWLTPHAMTMSEPLTDDIASLQKQHLAARVVITFEKKVTISMLRFWNYNKSREHSNRGIRRVEVLLDDKVIFDGEVKQAPGLVNSPDDCSEVILFTTDTTTLDNIAFFDAEQGYTTLEDDPTTKWLRRFNAKKQIDRPRTAEKSQIGLYALSADTKWEDRPTTAAIRPAPLVPKTKALPSVPETPVKPLRSPTLTPNTMSDLAVTKCRRIHLLIHSTWGDLSYVGMTGIEVLLGTMQRDSTMGIIVAELDGKCITADDDLSSVGVLDDYRTADKLLDGVNNTTDDHHMWLIPYRGGGKNTHQSVLTIDLVTPSNVVGLRVWNYNKSRDDVLRGVKRCEIVVEGDAKRSLGGVELRLAPGCDGVEYAQDVYFTDLMSMEYFRSVRCLDSYRTPALKQDYETLQTPSGRLFKITLFSNHGDGYYIGLDGLQFLDSTGADLMVSGRAKVDACPAGLIDINVEDTRVVSNILQQPYSDPSGALTWLAPLTHCMSERERKNSGLRTHPRGSKEGAEYQYFDDNVLYVMFDRAVSVSIIRFYNYSKTPKRGVKDVMIECDGRTLYMGSLEIATEEKISDGQSIVFSNDPKLVRMEKNKMQVRYCGAGEQDVLCINEKQVMIRSKAMYETPNASTKGVPANIEVRPMTALAKE